MERRGRCKFKNNPRRNSNPEIAARIHTCSAASHRLDNADPPNICIESNLRQPSRGNSNSHQRNYQVSDIRPSRDSAALSRLLRLNSALRLLDPLNLGFLQLRVRHLRYINRRVAIEKFIDLLHRRIPSLHNEEVDDPDLKNQKHTIEQIIFPCESFKSNGVHVLVKEER